MNYRHQLKIEYPNRSDEHMITVKHLRDTNFDENYQYVEKGFWHKIKKGLFFIVSNLIAIPLCTIRHGLRIKGRNILKKFKKQFKDGAITICNHVLMWDYLCVLKAVRPHLPYFPGWKTNFEGPNGPLIRWAGGIPVPTDSLRAMAKFKKSIDSVLENKKWLHFFPEGSMWFFYPDIRPLKPAVFKYAVKHNKPVIPMAISFRESKGLRRLFSKKPCATLTIGEPIFPDLTLSVPEGVSKMHEQAYHDMQGLVGVYPGDPTYNTDQNIETYKKTM